MKKKEDVLVFFDSQRGLDDIKKEILSFGNLDFEVVNYSDEPIGFVYLNKQSGNSLKEPVSLQELKNILAAEYLKPGDEVVLGIGDDTSDATFMGMKGCIFEAQYSFDVDMCLEPLVGTGYFRDFIGYQNKTDEDVAIIERLHDTLLDNHGYSLDSKLLTDARTLANKLKNK